MPPTSTTLLEELVLEPVAPTESITPNSGPAYLESLGVRSARLIHSTTYELAGEVVVDETTTYDFRIDPLAFVYERRRVIAENDLFSGVPGVYGGRGVAVDGLMYTAGLEGSDWYRSHYGPGPVVGYNASIWIRQLLAEGHAIDTREVTGITVIHLTLAEDDPSPDLRFEEGELDTLVLEGDFTPDGALVSVIAESTGTYTRRGQSEPLVINDRLELVEVDHGNGMIEPPALAGDWEARYIANLMLDVVDIAIPRIDDQGNRSFLSIEEVQAQLTQASGYVDAPLVAPLGADVSPLTPLYALGDDHLIIVIEDLSGRYFCHATGGSVDKFPEYGSGPALMTDYDSCAGGDPYNPIDYYR